MDINMPIMDGLTALKLIKQKFDEANQNLILDGKQGMILRPVIMFFSQMDKKQTSLFIKEDEQADGYLEKPVSKKELVSLLKLLNIRESGQI